MKALPSLQTILTMNKALSKLIARQAVVMVALSCMSVSVLAAEVEALSRPAVQSRLGANSYLLGMARAGDRIVVVGERGLTLVSDDEGSDWRQVPVPVSVTLTAVQFADANSGFIVGHGGSVLATKDNGEQWSLVLDGRSIAQTVLQSANNSDDEEMIAFAERMVADGPDKPLLDLLVIDKDNVLVVGAYGIVMRTNDGGSTWTSLVDQIDNPLGLHIYAIDQKDNRMLMAGEQGMVWLSRDNGESFEVIETPYFGSFFTANLLGSDEIVLAGLRGNVWRSIDNGINWNELTAPTPVTINASLQNADGTLLLANQSGMILKLDGEALATISSHPLPPLNSILELASGDYLMASQRGVVSTGNAGLDVPK